MPKRKIAVITGSRAEYGILYEVIRLINDDPALTLQLIVTGMHLSPQFGLTVRDIERDGFPIAARIKMPLSSDKEESITRAMGMEKSMASREATVAVVRLSFTAERISGEKMIRPLPSHLT